MKTIRLLNYAIGFLSVFGFLACSDHLIPAVSPGLSEVRLRVKTLTQELPGNVLKVSSFQYDAQGRLRSVVAYQAPDSTQAPVDRNSYQYDAQNRLIQHQRLITRPVSAGKIERYQYTYNAAGQVGDINYFNDANSPGTPILYYTVTLEFTSANKLKRLHRVLNPIFLPTRRDLLLEKLVFTGDNLTSFHSQLTFDSVPYLNTIDSENILTYDDKVNPFYGVYLIPAATGHISPTNFPDFNTTYFGGFDLTTVSRNNLRTSFQQNGDILISYSYTYNGFNLPTSRSTIRFNTVIEKLLFEYESY